MARCTTPYTSPEIARSISSAEAAPSYDVEPRDLDQRTPEQHERRVREAQERPDKVAGARSTTTSITVSSGKGRWV
ncbi:MAG: hypothetical protein KJ587_09720 [Alphaproteobacteria bacterium]|nr:hypothetical protein [Alphaproteobacteria bacterium]